MPPNTSLSQTLQPVVYLNECGNEYRPSGYTVPMRRLHRTVVEYVPHGTWLVEGGDGARLRATPGRIFVVPTDHSHRLTQVSRRGTQSYWWFLSLLDPMGRDVMRQLPQPWLLSPATSRRVIALLERVCTVGASHSGLSGQLEFQELQYAALRLLLESCPHPLTLQGQTDPRIEPVLHHIRDHLHERLTRSILADLSHLSPTRFHYVFTEATGMAPTQYLIAQRMQRARELLFATGQSVKQVALACGYGEPARFSRLFHAKVGIPPLEYRRQAATG